MGEFVIWMIISATLFYAGDQALKIWRERPVCIRTSSGKWRSARRVSREQEQRATKTPGVTISTTERRGHSL